jgi:DNA (cytosine-5)-methyltransferase 3A
MVVLSLFDGCSCGQLALARAGIHVDKYYASEIDEAAMSVAKHNFPNTVFVGDVRNLNENSLEERPDLIIGGSPCQSFSFMGKRNGMSTESEELILSLDQYLKLKEENFSFSGQSYLFWEYVRILKLFKPKHFLLENVMMDKKWEKVISETLGVEPIVIDSALVSAQSRKRNYWTNIPNISQPKDLNINLEDILEKEYDRSLEYHGPLDRVTELKRQKSGMIFYAGIPRSSGKTWGKSGKVQVGNYSAGYRVFHSWGKYCTQTLTKCNLVFDRTVVRKLSSVEIERLQTFPDNYTSKAKKTNRMKMIGNGWTISVIAHIFQNIQQDAPIHI